MKPRLVDTELADAFRDGRDEERGQLATAEPVRPLVIARMRTFEADIHGLSLRVERLRGRLSADNDWLTQHPEGA